MQDGLSHLLLVCLQVLQRLRHWLMRPARQRWGRARRPAQSRKVFAQPKPRWVQQEIIRLKALMPQAGCRTIAHTFNRRWRGRRQMTVSKTYVAGMCRKQQYAILHARRKLKHRIPRPIPHNRVWGCDLLTKTDRHGQPHLALAILDHGSRACLRLQRLGDKSSWTVLQELVQAVKRYGRPVFLRTDNEAVLVSRRFRLGLWVLGIRQQRIDRGCPGRTGAWNASSARSSGNWRLNRLWVANTTRGRCRKFAPGTTTSDPTITYRDGHPPKYGRASISS